MRTDDRSSPPSRVARRACIVWGDQLPPPPRAEPPHRQGTPAPSHAASVRSGAPLTYREARRSRSNFGLSSPPTTRRRGDGTPPAGGRRPLRRARRGRRGARGAAAWGGRRRRCWQRDADTREGASRLMVGRRRGRWTRAEGPPTLPPPQDSPSPPPPSSALEPRGRKGRAGRSRSCQAAALSGRNYQQKRNDEISEKLSKR